MNPAVTIHISVGSDGAVTSREAAQGGIAAEAPVPMSLADLQASGTGIAPAPLSLAELAAATASTAAQASASPPAPMPISQLVAVSADMAPAPQALGSLGAGGGAAGPPEPVALTDLGSPADTPATPASRRPAGR